MDIEDIIEYCAIYLVYLSIVYSFFIKIIILISFMHSLCFYLIAYGMWERRAPLGPEHVRELTKQGIKVLVQPCKRRIFIDEEYKNAGIYALVYLFT